MSLLFLVECVVIANLSFQRLLLTYEALGPNQDENRPLQR